MERLKIPVHRCRGLGQNDTHFLQKSPADCELQGTAPSDRRVPEMRSGRIPSTDRVGMATAPQDM